MLALLSEMVDRGFRVYAYASKEYQMQIQAAHAIFRELFIYKERYQTVFGEKEGDTAYFTLSSLQSIASWELSMNTFAARVLIQEISKINPSLLLYNSLFQFPEQLAAILHIPCISVFSSYPYNPLWLNQHAEYCLSKAFCLEKPYCRDADTTVKTLRAMSILCARNHGEKSLYSINKNFLLNNRYSFGNYSIVFDIPKAQIFETPVNPSLRFYGSYTMEFKEKHVFHRRKKVIVTFGNQHLFLNDQFRTNYAQILVTLSKFQCDTVVAAPEQFQLDSLVASKHTLIRSKIDLQRELVNADLFITHGGMCGVREAMYFEVPCLVMPVHADNFLVADMISNHGLGAVHQLGQSLCDLEQKIRRLLTDDTVSHRVARWSVKLKSSGGEAKAVNEIVSFLHSSSAAREVES